VEHVGLLYGEGGVQIPSREGVILRAKWGRPRVGHGLDASMDWTGLGWIGLDWVECWKNLYGLDWIGLRRMDDVILCYLFIITPDGSQTYKTVIYTLYRWTKQAK